MSFNGKTAIVTGGAGALGSVIARAFLHAGASVAIPYNSRNSLDAVPDLANDGRVFTSKTDLTLEKDVDLFTSDTEKKFGTVDFLVNAAGGYVGGKTIAEVPVEEWDSIINLNLKTAFLACRSALRIMGKRNFGRIINIASMIALSPSATKGSYAVSKRGVITLTEAIHEEVKGTGITVNAIAPSIILTEANKQWMSMADEKKWVTPEEIAALVLFLCSDDARSIGGNTVKIYGGV
ncbi:MAG: SDR family oxidoreductase [Bacteroidota bacterium]